MEEKNKNYIQVGINFANLVKSTLGPKGMNKMVVSDKDSKHLVVLTNDGATILKNVKTDNPITELFKNLAVGQEEASGDGTTTASILAGQLLENALTLLEKGVHQTTIINGYNIAMIEAINYLNQVKEKAPTEKIIKTSFGSKIPKELSEKLTNLLKDLSKEELNLLRIFKRPNSNPLNTKIIDGFAFEGYTINDRMKSEADGKIAVLDFRANMDNTKIQVDKAEEWEKANKVDREYRRKIVNKLKELNVKCVFISDTNPEFEAYLTEGGITGIVVYKRETLDNICYSTGAIAISSPDDLKDEHIGKGKVKYIKPKQIYIEGKGKTLVLCGSTLQTLDESERALDDVINLLLKNDEYCVLGAGSIEVELSLHLTEFAKKVGGKEQIAIEKFAEALEIIPLAIAENAGLDAVEILTALKTLHSKGQRMGVDIVKKISSPRERGIFEPVIMKINAVSSATNVANLILKLDEVLIGDDKRDNSKL